MAGAAAGANNDHLAKLGLWWTGGTGSRSDALLNQDYMIGSNATKEGSSSAGSEPSAPPRHQHRVAPIGTPLAIAVATSDSHGHDSVDERKRDEPVYMSSPATVIATRPVPGRKAPVPVPAAKASANGVTNATASDDHSNRPKSYSEWRDELLATTTPAPAQGAGDMYTQVDRRKHHDHLASVTHLRSMQEIYASTDRTQIPSQNPHDDVRSLDTAHPVANGGKLGEEKKVAWLQECVRTVQALKGFGPRKLNQAEIGEP